MTIGLVGRKCGMTRVFTEAGESVPVTVVQVLANRVAQVKNSDVDGYRAVQLTYGTRRPQLLTKAVAGHYAKLGVAPGRSLVEFRLVGNEAADIQPGTEFTAEMFATGKAPAAIVQEKGLAQVSDTGAIEKFCDEAIAANPAPVADYKAGKVAALNSLKGQVMKLSKGKANPALVGEILEKKLKA
jgi:hypothetical protein